MSKVLAALSVSVDGFITGPGPGPGRGLGDEFPEHISLEIVDVVPAPGVTHLHYRVIR
ncbi:hypothetical protein [Nocardioides sp. NPDC004968]|uniref:hypothetical protein n=1 Tax=Nocardioides sp. NPDC004968 TaxID=3155894 RepID=UPI0033A55E1E